MQQNAVNPKVIWELNFSGLYSEMLQIKSFFDAHAPGGKPFYWTDEDGTKHTVRFATDELKFDQQYGCDETGFSVKAYKCTIQIRKVYV